jgi:hypothetical protein
MKNPTDIFADDDRSIDTYHMTRIHWYFFVEYLLMQSGYFVTDLLAPVKDKLNCHHLSISKELLEFMYFLIFEYVHHRRVYKGAVGRSNFKQYMENIQFFVDVAKREYEDLFGIKEFMSESAVKVKHENTIKFYKYYYYYLYFH